MSCANCGVKQERWKDASGKEATNIDPFSRLCVACLVAATKGEQPAPMDQPFDAKQAQTGERD